MTSFAWTDNDLDADDVRSVYAECDGDLKACASALHVGYEAMRWHILRLGLDKLQGIAPPEDGEGAMGHQEFTFFVWDTRNRCTNWPAPDWEYDPAAETERIDLEKLWQR